MPSALDAAVDAANLLSQSGRYEEAAKAYEQVLAAEAQHFGALANFALQRMEEGRAAEAVGLLERALQANETWAAGHYNLANLLAERGPEGEASAIGHYHRAAELDPADPDTLNNLSVCLSRAGKLQEALAAATRALRLDKANERVQANIAELYYELGDAKKALFFAQRCMKRGHKPAARLAGALLAAQGRREEACACFEAGLAGLDSRVRYWSLLQALGKPERAQEVLAVPGADLLGQQAVELLCGGGVPPAAALEAAAASADLSAACEQLALHAALPHAEQLVHKCLVAENLKRAGLEALAPETALCESVDDVWARLDGDKDTWYLKDPAVQRGQGIRILAPPHDREALAKAGLPPRRVCLQRAVRPLLLDGVKFGVRMHVLVVRRGSGKDDGLTSLAVLMCQDGILTKCARAFDAVDTSPLAQITCTSVQRGEAGFEREKVKGPATALWPGFREQLPALEAAVLDTVRCCAAGLVEGLPAGRARVAQLFGYDFLFREEDGSPVFIEANASPQFQDAKALASMRDAIARPLINGLPEALVLEEGEASRCFANASGRWKWVGEVSSSSSSSSSSSLAS